MSDQSSLEQQFNEHSDVLRQFALEFIKEKQRKRRWGIFFKTLFLLLLIILVIILWPDDKKENWLQDTPHAALIEINGTILDGGDVTANKVAQSLADAYQDKGTKAIILKINSPGGSPVQADYIYNDLNRYRRLHPNIKIYAVCTDLCASAAYYVAAAADEIYANPSSLVGSIGVLYNGFGFVGAMQKVGIERRLLTAGKYKGFLDPFSPINSEQEKYLQLMLDSVHVQFEEKVKQGRGARLKYTTPDLFSGLVWTGIQAKQIGLIDGFGSTGYVAREIVKTEHIVSYTKTPSYFEKIVQQFGASFSGELLMKLGISGSPLR